MKAKENKQIYENAPHHQESAERVMKENEPKHSRTSASIEHIDIEIGDHSQRSPRTIEIISDVADAMPSPIKYRKLDSFKENLNASNCVPTAESIPLIPSQTANTEPPNQNLNVSDDNYPRFHVLSCFDLSNPCGNIFSLQSIRRYSIVFYCTSHQIFCLIRKWRQHWELVEIPLYADSNDAYNRGLSSLSGMSGLSSTHSHSTGHVMEAVNADLEIVSFVASVYHQGAKGSSTATNNIMSEVINPTSSTNVGSNTPLRMLGNISDTTNGRSTDIILSVGFVHPLMKQNATLHFYRINTLQLLKGSQQNLVTSLGNLQADVGGGVVRSHSTTSLSNILNRRSHDKPALSPSSGARSRPILSSEFRENLLSGHAEEVSNEGTDINTLQIESRRIVNSESMPLIRSRSESKLFTKASLFEVKRSKRHVSSTLFGSYALPTVPMRHYPLNVSFSTVSGDAITSEKKRVYIVTSTEKNIHCFLHEDRGTLVQIEIADILPELSTSFLKSSILTLNILQHQRLRLIAIGGQNGWVRLTIFDTLEKRVLNTVELFLNGPVSSLQFIHASKKERLVHPELSKINEQIYAHHNSSAEVDIGLVVAESTGRVILFKNIIQNLFSHREEIGTFDDAVLCVEVADLYGSGTPCILVGTYSSKLYIYIQRGEKFNLQQVEFFESPVYAIQVIDIVKDGVREIVVLTMYQICILQVGLDAMRESLRRKLVKYQEIKNLIQKYEELNVKYNEVNSNASESNDPPSNESTKLESETCNENNKHFAIKSAIQDPSKNSDRDNDLNDEDDDEDDDEYDEEDEDEEDEDEEDEDNEIDEDVDVAKYNEML